ncbi:hypothetical protein ABBQ38_001439 [Trebouxia sp. C0009 RCD-2024]
MQVEASRLISGTYARCMCLHPRLPIVALSVSGLVAEYDLVSGCKLGSTEAGGTPISLAYTSDASLLVAVLQERGVIAWSPQIWKRKVLLDSSTKSSEKPWYNAHLAVTPGAQPQILYCQHGSTSVRLVYTVMPAPVAGKKSTEKQGAQLRGDNKKPIVAMTCHPSVDNSKKGITRGVISAQNHPLRTGTGSALIAVGTSSGTVAMLESNGRSEARKMEQKELVMEGGVVGIGINLAACQVTAFARDSRGDGHAYAWQLLGTSHGSTLRPLAIEPSSLGDAVQGNANSRQAGPATATAAASSWQTLWGATPSWATNTGSASHVIGKVHTHPLTGQLVLHWLPTARWESLASMPTSKLAPSDAASAKQLLTATVMQALQTSDPGASTGLAAVARQHTPLTFWGGEGSSFSKRLVFARHVYMLDGHHLAAFKPLTGKCTQVQVLPDSNTAGQNHMACKLLHSTKQAAFVLFYRVLEGGGKGALLTPGALEWTLIPEIKMGEEKSMVWTLPGAAGCFLGVQHQYLAILANDGMTVSVYDLAKIGPSPTAALVLDTSSSGAVNIFPGPDPLPQPTEDGSTSGEQFMSSPSLVWVTEDGNLALGDMPNVGGYRGRRAALQPKHTLSLALSESVLEVAWQQLTEDSSSSALTQQSGSLLSAAAVVTSQRLLIVGPDLTVLASTPQRSSGASITSALWVGPALLYCDSANAVSQLGWDSSVHPVCHLAGGSLPVLAAALADRLLIARSSPRLSGRVDVSPRCVTLLQPLLMGWATLSARGFLPGGYWRARREMTALIRVYDSSAVTISLLTLLAAAGFADLSLALAQNDAAFQLSFLDQAAAKAAAGQWGDAVGQVVADHKRSLGYPKPPAAGSPMHRRLVAMGRAAAAYGKFQAAREAFAAAGQWVELMPLCALQGDFASLRDYAARVSGTQDGLDGKVLAEELLALESHFNQSTMNPMGGTKMAGDWTVTIDGGAGRTSYPDEEPLEVAPPGSLPMMETAPGPSGAPSAGDGVGRLSQMDIADPASYLGVGGGARGVARRVTEEGDNDDEEGGFRIGGPGAPGTEDPGDFSDGEGDLAANSAAQAAARAAFTEDKAADTFYSSDEDESEDKSSVTGSFVSASAGSMSEPSKKFKVVIKSKEEAAAGTTDLKAAAQGLRLPSPNTALAPPPGAPAAFQVPKNEDWRSKFRSSDSFSSDRSAADLSPQTSGVPSPMASPAGSGKLGGPPMRASGLGRPSGGSLLPPGGNQSRGAQLPPPAPTSTLLPPPFPPGNSPMRPPPSPRLTSPGGAPLPVGLHAKGVSLMEAGKWDLAVKAFGQALDNARGSACTKEAQYLAAVRLLKEGARVTGPGSAKLKRFAAALKLDDKHHTALVQSAAAHNMEVGNYGYAGKQLRWLVSKASGSGNSAFIVQLQQAVQECENKGNSDATVPREEDLETFAEIVGTATDADDVDSSIGPLLAGM